MGHGAWALLGGAGAVAALWLWPGAKEPFRTYDLKGWADELLRAAAAQDPTDAYVATARSAITAVVEFDDKDMINYERRTVRRGKFDRTNGVMHVSTRRPDGTTLPAAVVRGVLVHEVAHAALPTGQHTAEWRELFVRLLRVATEDLGWEVALECSACAYYGLCADECPKCTRIQCKTLPGVAGVAGVTGWR